MHTLLRPVNESQGRLLTLLGHTFRDRGYWPSWQFVEASLDREGVEPFSVVETLPDIGTRQGIYGLTYGLVWTQGMLGRCISPAIRSDSLSRDGSRYGRMMWSDFSRCAQAGDNIS